MVKQQFEVAKGHKDYFGTEAILRNQTRNVLKDIFERYGYQPLETPLIEDQATIGFKGGGEIQKEVFQLSDQGGRSLALRFDQTVPLARFVASNREIRFPFKRYAIGPVFRDGPTQPEQGRYRSFTQCDVDVLGVKEMTAEAELFALAQDAFEALGLGGVEIKINNRKLLDGLLDYAGVPDHAKIRTIITLDKMDKIGIDGVREALTSLTFSDKQASLTNTTLGKLMEGYDSDGAQALQTLRPTIIAEVGIKGYEDLQRIFQETQNAGDLFPRVADYTTGGELLLTPENVCRIMDVIRVQGDNQELYSRLSQLINSPRGKEGLAELKQLLYYGEAMQIGSLRFEPSLARGLDYYTGTTIEVYLKDRSIVNSAILAGGRFDDMVGDFRGGEDIPAVGFSFGLERLVMILQGQRTNLPTNTTQLYLIPIGTTGTCLHIAHELRRAAVNVDMEMVHNKIGKSIGYAASVGIPYVGLVGPDEIAAGVIKIKELATGNQENVTVPQVPNYLKEKMK